MFGLAVFLLNLALRTKFEGIIHLSIKRCHGNIRAVIPAMFSRGWAVVIIVVQGVFYRRASRADFRNWGHQPPGRFLLVRGAGDDDADGGECVMVFSAIFLANDDLHDPSLRRFRTSESNPNLRRESGDSQRRNRQVLWGRFNPWGSLGQVLGLVIAGPLYELGGGGHDFWFWQFHQFLCCYW